MRPMKEMHPVGRDEWCGSVVGPGLPVQSPHGMGNVLRKDAVNRHRHPCAIPHPYTCCCGGGCLFLMRVKQRGPGLPGLPSTTTAVVSGRGALCGPGAAPPARALGTPGDAPLASFGAAVRADFRGEARGSGPCFRFAAAARVKGDAGLGAESILAISLSAFKVLLPLEVERFGSTTAVTAKGFAVPVSAPRAGEPSSSRRFLKKVFIQQA